MLNVFPEPAGQMLRNAEPPVGATRRRVRTAHGGKYLIDFYPAVVDALDELVHEGCVELGWLTTWGPNMRAVVEQAFDGRLAGGFVLKKMPAKVRGFRPADWKLTGLRERVAATGQSWVWADDEEVEIARRQYGLGNDQTLTAVPGLPIATDQSVGLTVDHVAEIRAFFGSHGNLGRAELTSQGHRTRMPDTVM